MTSSPRFAIPALLAANALLALGPMLVRMSDTGPIAAAFWRTALALPLLTAAALVVRRGRPAGFTGPLMTLIAFGGVLFAADLASWHEGIVRTKAANATLFGNSASFLFPLYGFFAARAWPTRRQGGALLLALFGAVLLMGRSLELSPRNFHGDLLSFAAGVFYALYFVVIARAREKLAPLPLLAASTFASAVPLLLLAWIMGERIIPLNWAPLIFLALGSQVAGQGLMTWALGTVSPLVIGLALLMQPVVAALTGWLAYGETLGPLDLVGAVLVGVALVLVRTPRTER